MTAEQAAHVSDLRKLAASIGPRILQSKNEGQISSAMHLHQARELLHKAIHSYNPARDERELQLELHDATGH